MNRHPRRAWLFALWVLVALGGCAGLAPDPLPSWNDTPTKQAIVAFARATTDATSKDYVPPEARIATFDMDGTLWVEHPMYTQVVFALERVREMAKANPALAGEEPFKTIALGDAAAMSKLTEADFFKAVAMSEGGLTVEGYFDVVRQWLRTARHPRYHRPYTDLVYAPMVDVMKYLRSVGYRTYIVTGSGQEFVRAFGEEALGVPPEQVIGTMLAIDYEKVSGAPSLVHRSGVVHIDDGPGKPVGINMVIGRRPYASFGNSNGDQQMLEWAKGGSGARLAMIVLHDDPLREYAYGPADGQPDTRVGRFTQSLYDEAKAGGWHVISMKNDWKRIFAFEP